MSAAIPISTLLANLSLNGNELIKWNSNGKLVPISENKQLNLTERTGSVSFSPRIVREEDEDSEHTFVFGSFTSAFTRLVLNDQPPSENVSKDKTEASKASVAKHKASSSKNKKRKYARDGFGIQSERVSRRRPKRGKNDSNREPKGKCFHCGVDGHWKRNCNKYLSELKEKKKGKFDLLVLETNLVEVDSQSWIIDSGSTNHICSSL